MEFKLFQFSPQIEKKIYCEIRRPPARRKTTTKLNAWDSQAKENVLICVQTKIQFIRTKHASNFLAIQETHSHVIYVYQMEFISTILILSILQKQCQEWKKERERKTHLSGDRERERKRKRTIYIALLNTR